jgi:hypothetical protein
MTDTKPWYRQFWPWFIFSLPGLAVVAGLSTWWVAERNADHMVADDYYKQGLAINRQLDRQRLARELQVEATLNIGNGVAEVLLNDSVAPPALLLILSHSMDSEQDLSLQLARVQPGNYRAPLPRQLQHRWHWRLEPIGTPSQQWRLDGEVTLTNPD